MVEQRKANPSVCRGKDKEKHDHPPCTLEQVQEQRYHRERKGKGRSEQRKVWPWGPGSTGPRLAIPTPTSRGQEQRSREPILKGGTQGHEVPRREQLITKGEVKGSLETRPRVAPPSSKPSFRVTPQRTGIFLQSKDKQVYATWSPCPCHEAHHPQRKRRNFGNLKRGWLKFKIKNPVKTGGR